MSAEKVAGLAQKLAEEMRESKTSKSVSIYSKMGIDRSGLPGRVGLTVFGFSAKTDKVFLQPGGWTTIKLIRNHGDYLMTKEERNRA